MNMNKTILYITDSVLDEQIAGVCRKQILKVAGENQIVSVSQKPLDFGKNICVGDIGRSWLNIYKQQLAGLKEVKTEFVAIAEHDCLYSEEHFNWIPPDKDTFFYNDNVWLAEWNGNHPELNGMYSRWTRNRKALSQLICSRQLLIDSINERLTLLEGGLKILRRLGEPGAFPLEVVQAARIATSGSHQHLSGLLENHLKKYKSDIFNTEISNLDIRHSSNFTGPRRGKHRCYSLPYWGGLKNIMEAV